MPVSPADPDASLTREDSLLFLDDLYDGLCDHFESTIQRVILPLRIDESYKDSYLELDFLVEDINTIIIFDLAFCSPNDADSITEAYNTSVMLLRRGFRVVRFREDPLPLTPLRNKNYAELSARADVPEVLEMFLRLTDHLPRYLDNGLRDWRHPIQQYQAKRIALNPREPRRTI